MIISDLRLSRGPNPLWWRIPAWTVMTVYTVVAAPSPVSRTAAGVLMGGAAVALQFVQHPKPAVRQVACVLATIGGLAASFASHSGVAEVLVAVAASRLPGAFQGRSLVVFTVVDSIAFAVTVGYVSRSVAGALAGLGIPLLVQRAIEQHELVVERDRAQALLVEARNAREAEAQAAALRERGRIAREMHDVLAHSLAGLSVHLQAVRAIAVGEHVPPSVLGPLDTAADLARDGLAEARAAVGALRDPVGLGVDALPALIDRHPGTATLVTRGAPREMAPEVGHAVYRAVQEALTNSARYAPGSAVAVSLDWRAEGLRVTIEDTGPGAGRTPITGQGSGLGLAGMAERVAEAQGSVTAGPREAGGWAVAIEVPVTAQKVER